MRNINIFEVEKELSQRIKEIGTKCGHCNNWMKSRLCPRERNINGFYRGPSCDEFICTQFVEDPFYTKYRDHLKSELDNLSREVAE